ncbi:MAG: hypothetical protein CME75_07910 [Halomonas sp.]|uniref:Uncharacterized protein n=1 Tax=Vreelandella hamiltonii TaxID=502829 RepID=A0A8H9I449_9GAMM|nr:hypothetical protein [Halomonas hamiltonii]MAP35681.1 hypothetical protein [Halomonas sp.]GGW23783.1 hypothetical protein GCM10007157_13970 [Halomonas hamiltonii]
MSTTTNAAPIRVRDAIGGYAATLKGQRATCAWSAEEAARKVARKVHGDQVDVVSAELAESDAKAGVKYRYHITQRGAA